MNILIVGSSSGLGKEIFEQNIKTDNQIYASVGPCIGKQSYEVDVKFFRRFLINSRSNKKYFTIKNKYKRLFNLRKFVTDKLRNEGVKVDQVNRNTFTDENNFFSYRRSSKLKHSDYGRCISVIRMV